MRGEYKTPGGKLVGVRVTHDGTGRWHCHVDGDFFIDGDDAETLTVVSAMERQLERCACLMDGGTDADNGRNLTVERRVDIR